MIDEETKKTNKEKFVKETGLIWEYIDPMQRRLIENYGRCSMLISYSPPPDEALAKIIGFKK